MIQYIMQLVINFNVLKIHTLSNKFVTSYLVYKSRERLYVCEPFI